MRDPELVARAQRAAARLESAWERWRALQGLGETPAQPVVGYVGYALKEPWGQPRAVIGFSADEAERLAEFLERDSGDYGAIDRTVLGKGTRETVPRQAQEPLAAPVLTVTPALDTDVLAVTSQLSGSQLGPSFLPGSGARLSITSAGQSVGLVIAVWARDGQAPARAQTLALRSDPPLLPGSADNSCERSTLPQLFCFAQVLPRCLATGQPSGWPGSPPSCSTCTGSRRSGSC
jgi:hypothetical protein